EHALANPRLAFDEDDLAASGRGLGKQCPESRQVLVTAHEGSRRRTGRRHPWGGRWRGGPLFRWKPGPRADEAEPAPMHRFDDTRCLRVVAEHLSQLAQRTRQGVVRNDGVAPHRHVQLILRDQDAGTLSEVAEQGPGLGAKCYGFLAMPQASGMQVEAMRRKLDHPPVS